MVASPTTSTPALILGAGLAGLSAALHLRADGAACRLVERAPHPGGHAVTIEDEGYRFDRTGHLLHLRDDAMRDLVLGLLGDRCLRVQRRSRVYSHGVYTRYPFQANTFGLPPDVAYECVMGFLQARRDRSDAPPDDFEQYCQKHFGAGFCRHFMLPYNEKLWGVPLRELTAAWCQRFVPQPTVEDVIAGAVGCNDRELGYNASFLYPQGGIGELPAALARAAGPIELGRTPRAIDAERRRVIFDDEVVGYERLISTLPLDSLGALLPDAPGEVRAAFARLRCTGLYYLDVALSAPLRQDLHWVYVPEPRFPFYRLGCYSHFSPAMAPPGAASLYVELADRRPPDLDRLLPDLLAQLVEMRLIASTRDVRFVRLRHLAHAYVIFDHHHEQALAVLRPYLSSRGITSTGRYGTWTYASMEDALLDGRAAARAFLDAQPA